MTQPLSPPGETPRVDARAFWTPCIDSPKLAEVLMADDARQLERELRRAQERCEELEEVLATARIHIANRGAFRSHVDMLYAIDTALTDAAASGPKGPE